MKLLEIKISISDITDALSLGNNSIVSAILNNAKDIIKQGGIVTIERRYENAEPTPLVTYKTVEDIKEWKQKLNEAQDSLGFEKIE